jgi:hypothetical protein
LFSDFINMREEDIREFQKAVALSFPGIGICFSSGKMRGILA